MFRWTVRVNGAPFPSWQCATAAVKDKLYVFGFSRDDDELHRLDVNIFNTVSLTWTTLPPVTGERHQCPPEVPTYRSGHKAVPIEHVIYVWGGNRGNRLYAFDAVSHRWFNPGRVSGAVPKARAHHSACALGKVMYVYGGEFRHGFHGESTISYNDICTLDTTTMVWSLVDTKGKQSHYLKHHSATIIGTKMFVFGGSDKEMRVFDTETNAWLNTPSAQLHCSCHGAFLYNGELCIFGNENHRPLGTTYVRTYNDLWKFNPETFSWKEVKPKGKGPFRMCQMGCGMVGDRLVVFGGHHNPVKDRGDNVYPDDVYILDLSPSLKSLCKLAVIQHRLVRSELPHDIRWELAAMTTNTNSDKNYEKKQRKPVIGKPVIRKPV